MKPFKHRRKTLTFSNTVGEVISTQKSNKVSVSTYHASSSTKNEVWIKKENGKEIVVNLSGEYPLRVGNKITLTAAYPEGKKNGNGVILINHDLERHWILNDSDDLNRLFNLQVFSMTSLFINLALLVSIFVLIMNLTNYNVPVALGSCGAFLLFQGVKGVVKYKGFKCKLDAHIAGLVKNISY
ncbi:hypothetical protein [Photobacterium lipolyticum]|uniref:Uncharacterized protein n=1 Tax=Photobacterium lipolyticum TaxID=266810 RepID=A0A2T3MW52_9GAMM|nr:hypothetical protein [Photobacterium lipolyticum]PSW04187.1 hypothetical protein C9I89_14510 [Photobacterium lipolyticum]